MLVPVADLADLAHVPVTVIKSLITIASVLNDTDYRKEGRNLQSLGLSDMTVAEVKKFLAEGGRSNRK